MSEVRWTKEQEQAIKEKGANILVAAAAGSGKTAVLVERIIQKIMSEKIDIDRLLVVTFTNAAASEMRERILDSLYKKIDEDPTNDFISRQITLLNKSNICTIHSFCLDVIKNNFYHINISPNFRIGEQTEVELLKQETLENLFESKYEENDPDFLKLVDIYTGYRGDDELKKIILDIYKFIQSSPFPEEWLEENVEKFNIPEGEDFSQTLWGKVLLENYKNTLNEIILGNESIKHKLDLNPELKKFSDAIALDLLNLRKLKELSDSWDDTYEALQNFKFEKWPVLGKKEKVDSFIKDEAKNKRDKLKSLLVSSGSTKGIREKIFIYNSKQAIQDMKDMYEILILIQKTILEFDKEFHKAEMEKNIVNFNDIEHYALKILLKKENGKYVPTDVAKSYQEKFVEIAIDEYQDSNQVQEYLLTSISRENNIFMVGDVKQSIYKFRQAMPELFLNKYNKYELAEEADGSFQIEKEKERDESLQMEKAKAEAKAVGDLNLAGTTKKDIKIQLFKNFRSRKNILAITNIIFQDIMSPSLGDVEYDKAEYLNLGASYPEPSEQDVEKVKIEKEQEKINAEENLKNNLKNASKEIREEREKELQKKEKINFAGKIELDIINLNAKSKADGEEQNEISPDEAKTKEASLKGINKTIENQETLKEEKTNLKREDPESNDESEDDNVEAIAVEAKFVANKIKEIVNGNYYVWDKKINQYRKATYKDIVILIRVNKGIAVEYEKELNELSIPVYSEGSDEYLDSQEIQTIMACLKIINNPIDDIPLVTVMRSMIGGFTDEDLIEIRINNKNSSYYDAIQSTLKNGKNKKLKLKITNFLRLIEDWKEANEYLALDELIWKIYVDTGYYNYVGLMQKGKLRQANLKMLFEKAKQYESASFKGLFNFINFINKLKLSSGDMESAKIIGENENVVRIMTIHKSKGLEFPIVFLANAGRNFNFNSLRKDEILLHQIYGIGPKYKNYERRIQYSTMAKEAIKLVSEKEIKSEEMRVLYVALTRAKEKLFIVGSQKDVGKSLEEKKDMLEAFKNDDENDNGKDAEEYDYGAEDGECLVDSYNDKINPLAVSKCKSFLDWIELVYLNHQNEEQNDSKLNEDDSNNLKLNNILKLNVIYKSDILKDQEQKEENISLKEKIKLLRKEYDKIASKDLYESQISKILNWKYVYEDSEKIPSEISVSKIKELENNAGSKDTIENKESEKYKIENAKKNENEIPNQELKHAQTHETSEEQEYCELQNNTIEKVNLEKPKFIMEKVKLTPAEKGTAMHLVMQKLNEKEEYDASKVKNMLDELVQREIMLKNEADSIDIEKVLKYTKSNIWKDLKKAKVVEHEKPFYLNMPANKIFDTKAEEKILIQGIIDLYYITEDDKLILLDYKTDYVKNDENELIQKYNKQLEIYKMALERGLKRKVDKVYIYSSFLGKEIEIK